MEKKLSAELDITPLVRHQPTPELQSSQKSPLRKKRMLPMSQNKDAQSISFHYNWRPVPLFFSVISVAAFTSFRSVSWSNLTLRTLVNPFNKGSDPTVGHTFTATSSDQKMVIPRSFNPWPKDHPFPCYPKEIDPKQNLLSQFDPTEYGFFFLKPYKTGSSTASGIHLRIARNVAQRHYRSSSNHSVVVEQTETQQVSNADSDRRMCQVIFDHGPQPYPAYQQFCNRSNEESFLWTMIREPTDRVISSFFHFEVSRRGRRPTSRNFRNYLLPINDETQPKHRDYYLRSLHPWKPFQQSLYDPVEAANEIIQSYNFIGLTERFDESVVILKLLLHLPMGDILYLSAKSSGGYDAGSEGVCTLIRPSFRTKEMQAIVDSKEWQDVIQYDRALYIAVNQSLDRTIDRWIGRDLFERELALFREAQRVAEKICAPRARFPCTADGELLSSKDTDCLWKDSGCGTECLDQIATQLNLW